MSEPIRVAVSGAGGRMGREVVQAVLEAGADMTLVGAADPAFEGCTVAEVLKLDCVVRFEKDIESVLNETDVDAAVVFSVPSTVMDDTRAIMKSKVVPIIGTTGITEENLKEIRELSTQYGVGAIIAPNFAIGAVLMMKMARGAAKYMPAVEIIELHHDRKLDAPSGTAIKTAQLISGNRGEYQGTAGGEDFPARGENVSGVQIHSVRLPGLIAHQEVIFGGLGQTLTIRHDSYDRKSFMPGVLMAIRKSVDLKKVVYGLENILD